MLGFSGIYKVTRYGKAIEIERDAKRLMDSTGRLTSSRVPEFRGPGVSRPALRPSDSGYRMVPRLCSTFDQVEIDRDRSWPRPTSTRLFAVECLR